VRSSRSGSFETGSTQRDQSNKAGPSELRYYRLYSNIEIGMLDYDVERMLGEPGTVVPEKTWPTKLGELPNYKFGCPRSLLVRADGEPDTSTYHPDNPIFWLRWDMDSGYWIAIACLGNEGRRNSTSASSIIAKRRSHQ
jgi:hypothetical protein